MVQIAICFYGITRSLKHTQKSIFKNVIAPARACADTRIVAHFFDEKEVLAANGRIDGSVDANDGRLLQPDWLDIEEPDSCLALWEFDKITAFGDAWNNNNVSTRNLVHQLHSMKKVTDEALKGGADIVIFARPDLKYWDTLAPVLDRAIAAQEDRVYLPSWQSWGGYNDRFAVAVGERAIAAYGQRVTRIIDFCTQTQGPLNAEFLVHFCLETAAIPVEKIPNRASRVRASGARVWESFGDDAAAVRHQKRKHMLWTALDRSGLKPVARKGFHFLQSLRK